MESEDLVSVIIISYNSSATVVELLDSIKSQTYDNVEIVVSDDCSTDNCVEVCEEWSKANSDQKMVVVRAEHNTGVSGNLNRGIKASNGKWIKIMAADDMLFEYSIESFVKYAELHHCAVCISKLGMFGSNARNIEIKQRFYNRFFDKYNNVPSEQRYKFILKECLLPSPGMFITRCLLDEIGLFDERFPFAEEWPTYLSILKRGYDIPYFDQELVSYRCEGNSLGSDSTNRLSLRVFRDTINSFRKFRRPLMLERGMYVEAWMETLSLNVRLIRYNDPLSIKDKLLIAALLVINPRSYVKAARIIFDK